MREEELKYALALTRLRGVSQNAALKLYDHYGTAQAVFENRKEVQGKVGEALADWTEVLNWAEKELEFCEKNRIKVFLRHDEDYPARLNECDDAPLVFYYRGNANLNARHVISIVGTRRITEYGRTICQTFYATYRLYLLNVWWLAVWLTALISTHTALAWKRTCQRSAFWPTVWTVFTQLCTERRRHRCSTKADCSRSTQR